MQSAVLQLPFGHTHLSVEVLTANLLGVITPLPFAAAGDENALVHAALERPIGTPRLRDVARAGQAVAIVISDLTRPCPSERLLPLILEELGAAGTPDDDVTIVAALGLHRPMSPAELEAAVGTDVYRRVRVLNHDPDDTVCLGVTSAGTPVEFFRPVVEADLRVCLGNLELHYFAGYSGGAKAIFPGCASERAVRANHAMMVRPEATAARIEGNPVRADLEEAVAALGVDFILNVLTDGEKRIVGAVAGGVTAAHRRGCQMVAERGVQAIPRRADIVAASAGGYPKDVNLYQAQKALDNAACAVRDGGVIVLVAECPEGLGNPTFEAWMREATSADEILHRIQREFVLGGHKAAAIAAVLRRARVLLVSALAPDAARYSGMIPHTDAGEALAEAFATVGANAQVLVLPQAGSVLPLPVGEGSRAGNPARPGYGTNTSERWTRGNGT